MPQPNDAIFIGKFSEELEREGYFAIREHWSLAYAKNDFKSMDPGENFSGPYEIEKVEENNYVAISRFVRDDFSQLFICVFSQEHEAAVEAEENFGYFYSCAELFHILKEYQHYPIFDYQV